MSKVRQARSGAVFLDRDGVINASPGDGFVTRWEDFKFLPGSLAALKRLHQRGEIVIVVSNQSGVGRGLFSKAQLDRIHQRMVETVEAAGGKIHAVYACPHAPDDRCACRKPAIGFLKRSVKRFGVDLKRSFVVGDDPRDVLMGHRAGCRTVLVLSGRLSRFQVKALPVAPNRIVSDLAQAVRWILRQLPEPGSRLKRALGTLG